MLLSSRSINDAEGPEGVSKGIPSYFDPSGASTIKVMLSSLSINDAEGPEGVLKEIPSYSDLTGGLATAAVLSRIFCSEVVLR